MVDEKSITICKLLPCLRQLADLHKIYNGLKIDLPPKHRSVRRRRRDGQLLGNDTCRHQPPRNHQLQQYGGIKRFEATASVSPPPDQIHPLLNDKSYSRSPSVLVAIATEYEHVKTRSFITSFSAKNFTVLRVAHSADRIKGCAGEHPALYQQSHRPSSIATSSERSLRLVGNRPRLPD